MTSVIQSIDVEVPVRVAYDQWTQFEEFPKFMSGVESIKQIDDRHLHWQISVDGQKREYDTEITEQHPDERVAWRSTDGSHGGVVTFHRLSESSARVTAQLDWNPEGVAEHIGALIGTDDRQVKNDLKRFKSFIEERGQATGAWRGDVAPGSSN